MGEIPGFSEKDTRLSGDDPNVGRRREEMVMVRLVPK